MPQDSVKHFKDWLRSPSGEYDYHDGLLLRDRWMLVAGLVYVHKQPIDQIARLAWNAYEQGKVNLFQRKLTEGRYIYTAQAISHSEEGTI